MNLKTVKHIYFIGIGGIGMSALARYFTVHGKMVAGYDKTPSKITESLEEVGVQIHFNDDINNIPAEFLNSDETIVVYTPAIPRVHTELQYFLENKFLVLKRAEVLGMITESTTCLAVAGTHGKTTTSSILGHIMKCANATSFLGGISENYNSNLILGGDQVSVVEADEFDRSFLKLSPDIACITSMDADHLDIYGNANELQKSFEEFSAKVSKLLLVAKGLPLQGLTYAVESEADYQATNVEIRNGSYWFDLKTPDQNIKNLKFHLPGRHNLMNAVAASAMADVYGVDAENIIKALDSFLGVQRRFSFKIKTDDFVLIDDYAHHPTEINAVYNSVKELYSDKNNLVVFQPHLYSRTRDFIDDFAVSLSQFDEVLLLDIYPARELPIEGVDSNWLLSKITASKKKLIQPNEIVENIKSSEAKIVSMLGAGDIGVMIENVKNELIKEVV